MDNYTTLYWQEEMNTVRIDCSLDMAVHPAKSNIIILTVPGVDGSVDGYDEKYKRIASNVNADNKAAVVRIGNPFITSFHWESNIRRALEYIEQNAKSISGSDEFELRIMAHSAGAAVVASLAWEYPQIGRLLLVNPAKKLWTERVVSNLGEFQSGHVYVVSGEFDDSKELPMPLNSKLKKILITNADHNFSGESLNYFVSLPEKYLL